MVTYHNEKLYIDSKKSYADKARAVDEIIEALLALAITEAANDGVQSYSLNDGQVIINSTKRGSQSIMNSINAFEKLKQYYVLKANGSRMTRLVDSKNFTGGGNGRFR
jgi:stage III sporulation protein SpoIIIAA